jgi:hypothetical protein
MSVENVEILSLTALKSGENSTKSRLVEDALSGLAADAGQLMFDRGKTSFAALAKMELVGGDGASMRGSGDPYPYPDQTSWSSPLNSRDPYKYQDGNIYNF